MDMVASLFEQYSIETLILTVIMLGLAVKAVSELIDWFSRKIESHFSGQTAEERHKEDVKQCLEDVREQLKELGQSIGVLTQRMDSLETQTKINIERLQENSRSYIIDKHHMFCYEVKGIDDYNLQSIERRYLYYKQAGGDSFIDDLMEEIRELPRLSIQHETVLWNHSKQDRG